MYGGSIKAANRPAGGAVFTVTLPPAAGAAALGEGEDEDRLATRSDGRARVLVSEDEAALAELVTLYLERQGHEVTTALEGEGGLRMALEGDFDLIVCDMQLPNMNGDEVLTRLLEQRPEMADHVVIATGDVLSPDTREFVEETGLPHIHKPFTLEQLSDLVRRRMAGHRPVPA